MNWEEKEEKYREAWQKLKIHDKVIIITMVVVGVGQMLVGIALILTGAGM